MNLKALLVIAFIVVVMSFIVVIVYPPGVSAQEKLNCFMKKDVDCDSSLPYPDKEIEVFRMVKKKNSHAQLPGQPPGQGYKWRVCCKGVTNLANSCSDTMSDVILRLSGQTNAHVEQNNQTTPAYNGNDACLSISGQGIGVNCEYDTDCANIGSDYDCVASISEKTNAHVSRCGNRGYQLKVCCSATTDADGPNMVFEPPPFPPVDGGTAVGDMGDFVNWVFINATYNEPLLPEPEGCVLDWAVTGQGATPHPMTINTLDMTCFLNTSSFAPGGLADDSYTYTVHGNDTSNNIGSTETRTVKITVDFPTSDITSPLDGDSFTESAWTGMGKVEGTASDVQNVITKVELTIMRSDGMYWDDSISDWTGTFTRFNSVDTSGCPGPNPCFSTWEYPFMPPVLHGGFTVTSNASDYSGNNQLSPLTSIRFGIDNIIPETTITNKLNGITTGPTTHQGEIFDQSNFGYTSGGEKIEYKLMFESGSSWIVALDWNSADVSYGPPGPPEETELVTWSLSIPDNIFNSYGPGHYNLSVRAIDYAGNMDASPDDDHFYYDPQYPSITIEHPSGPVPYSQSYWESIIPEPIWGTAEDQIGVTGVEVSIEEVSSGLFWDGSSFSPGEVWLTANDISGFGLSPYRTWQYIFTPNNDGVYTIKANATDTDDQGTLAMETITYDTTPPQVWIEDIPDYLSSNYIPVTWNGYDLFGIEEFSIEYSTDSDQGPWNEWVNSSIPKTMNFAPVANSQIYFFKATARDYAGNENQSLVENTTIDIISPICTMDVFQGGFSTSTASNPLTATWQVVEDESAVGQMDVWIRDVTSGGDWEHINDPNGNPQTSYGCGTVGPSSRSVQCDSMPEHVYDFMCGATDLAQNVGLNSTIESVTVDVTTPYMGTVTSPGEWINANPFTLEWEVNDPWSGSVPGSGIDFYNVQWRPLGGTWANITDIGGSPELINLTSIVFSGGTAWGPPVINEGDTFEFQVRGQDNVGQMGSWTDPPANVSVDTFLPTTIVIAYDQDRQQIINGNLQNVTEVTVESAASDPGASASGIAKHTIWVQWTDEGIFRAEFDCTGSELESCDVNMSSELNVPVESADEIIYWVVVEDKAGNVFESDHEILATHPLANFVVHDLFIAMGTSALVEVQVRNLDAFTKNITLSNLDGYQLAGFVEEGSIGDWENITFNPDGSVKIEGIISKGRGVVMVNIQSSDPDSSGDLTLDAIDSQKPIAVTDQDTLHISVGFPASFSGLTDWALLLLVALAVGAFHFRKRK